MGTETKISTWYSTLPTVSEAFTAAILAMSAPRVSPRERPLISRRRSRVFLSPDFRASANRMAGGIKKISERTVREADWGPVGFSTLLIKAHKK